MSSALVKPVLLCSTQTWGAHGKLKKVQSRAADIVQVLHENDLACKTSEAASICLKHLFVRSKTGR